MNDVDDKERNGDPPTSDDLGDEAPDDQRGTEAPDEQGDPEPEPGEDPGPHGNPAQDEEGLSHEQQDSS
jgi:hypothetical protein